MQSNNFSLMNAWLLREHVKQAAMRMCIILYATNNSQTLSCSKHFILNRGNITCRAASSNTHMLTTGQKNNAMLGCYYSANSYLKENQLGASFYTCSAINQPHEEVNTDTFLNESTFSAETCKLFKYVIINIKSSNQTVSCQNSNSV